MRYRTVLVDDEPLALKRLQRLLEAHADGVEVVGTATSGLEAVQVIERLRPELVFLDIQMPECDGFEVLKRLSYMPRIIFSTAYDQYALQAFEVHSIDYLLKPVDPRRLQMALQKLVRLSESGIVDLRSRIEQVLEGLAGGTPKRLQIRVGDRIRLLPVSEILFFRASDKYVEAHTAEGMHLLSKSLTQLESELPARDFVRIHRGILVNINQIEEIRRLGADSYVVRMRDSKRSELPVSRRYRSRLDLG